MKTKAYTADAHKLLALVLLILLFMIWLRGMALLTAVSVNGGYSLLNQTLAAPNEWTRELAFNLFQRAATWQNNDTVWRALGHMYAAQGEEEAAVAKWQMVDNQAMIRQELHSWALINEQKRDNQAALTWYERAILLNPETADAWYFAARILGAKGDSITARSYYQTSLDTGQFSAVGPSDIALNLGILAHTQEQWLEAQQWFDLALEASDFRVAERAWQAHYLRGDTWRLMDEPALALLDYQWVVDHNPNHYWAHIYLAQMVWLLDANLNEADALLLEATAIDPTRKWAYRVRGDLYRQSNRREEAIEMYRLVLVLDPRDTLAQHYLEELGDHDN